MKNLSAISQNLFAKIRNQFPEVSLGGENAEHTSDPAEARFFNFSFVAAGEDYGNITVSISDGKSLKVFFTRNISASMPPPARKLWYAFLKEMRFFALRNFLTFDPRDISRPQLTVRDMVNTASSHPRTYSASEVAESRMYGSARRSFEKVGEARILVKHTNAIDPTVRGSRSRQIESIFIETSEGERFKLPFTTLTGARAMANHVRQGGLIGDKIGHYITGVVAEMASLRGFVRGARHCVLEDSTAKSVVEAAINYYGELHEQLHILKGPRSYRRFVAGYQTPLDLQYSDSTNTLAEYFGESALNVYLETAGPALCRAKRRYVTATEPLASKEFEQWLNNTVSEALGQQGAVDVDALNELMQQPIVFGPGCSNVIAVVGELIQDGSLVDWLMQEITSDADDSRPAIYSWLQTNMPDVAEVISVPDASAEQTDETIDRYDMQGSFVDSVEAKPAKKPKHSALSQISKLAGIK